MGNLIFSSRSRSGPDIPLVEAAINVQTDHVTVTYSFYMGRPNSFTIVHTYDSLLDLLSNPKKKYDLYQDVWCFSNQNWVTQEKPSFFDSEKDYELHEKLSLLNIYPKSSGVDNAYAWVNNRTLRGARRLLAEQYSNGNRVFIAEAFKGDMIISITRSKNSSGEHLYHGRWTHKGDYFHWISVNPYVLLSILMNACHVYCLKTNKPTTLKWCFDKINYQLAHLSLFDNTWIEKAYIDTSIISNDLKILTTITIASSCDVWKADIETAYNDQLPINYDYLQTISIFESTLENLIQTLTSERLLTMLITKYDLYKNNIKTGVNQLQALGINTISSGCLPIVKKELNIFF